MKKIKLLNHIGLNKYLFLHDYSYLLFFNALLVLFPKFLVAFLYTFCQNLTFFVK
jgi:hypothetical protein